MQSRLFGLMALVAIVSISGCEREPAQPTTEVIQADAEASADSQVGCSPAVAAAIERGVVDLHNMMYVTARNVFEGVARADADCAMAHWGVAMSYIHPLWNDPPTNEQIDSMEARVRDAVAKATPTARERAYLNTAHAFFDGARART